MLTSLFVFFASPVFAVDTTFTTGGTNFSVYDLGSYGTNPSESTWNTISFVIPHYDLNPTRVQQQLQSMCDAGQKKLGFVLWYMPAGYDQGFVDSSTGKPTQKVEQNIKNLLIAVKTIQNHMLKPCFNELQFRFASLGAADPSTWPTWDENRYIQNKSFIWYTRNIVTTSLQNSTITPYFDLGVELGGITTNQSKQYQIRLWQDYVASFGKTDTYGFSIAWDTGRFLELYTVFQQAGSWPDQYAVDVYDPRNAGILAQLTTLLSEMTQHRQQQKPVLIQETFATDQTALEDILQAKNAGLQVRSIMQWQVTRNEFFRTDGQVRHFSVVLPEYLYFGPEHNPVPWPANLSATCNTGNSSITLRWDTIIGSTLYPLRMDDRSNNGPSCLYGWYCLNSTDVLLDTHTTNTFTTPIIPGHPYSWWVHAVTPTGYSDYSAGQFTCGKPGDANGDNLVNAADFLMWRARDDRADFDHNQTVDGKDFILWLLNYQS